MESLWGALKTDSGLDTAIPSNRRHAELAVFDYIETFYNPRIRHSSIGFNAPVAFEKHQQRNSIKAA
jgi:transposase InsO family protein